MGILIVKDRRSDRLVVTTDQHFLSPAHGQYCLIQESEGVLQISKISYLLSLCCWVFKVKFVIVEDMKCNIWWVNLIVGPLL